MESQGEVFIDMVIAGMLSAAAERKLTQFKCKITPEGMREQNVRIIIVPETMDAEWPGGLGKEP